MCSALHQCVFVISDGRHIQLARSRCRRKEAEEPVWPEVAKRAPRECRPPFFHRPLLSPPPSPHAESTCWTHCVPTRRGLRRPSGLCCEYWTIMFMLLNIFNNSQVYSVIFLINIHRFVWMWMWFKLYLLDAERNDSDFCCRIFFFQVRL